MTPLPSHNLGHAQTESLSLDSLEVAEDRMAEISALMNALGGPPPVDAGAAEAALVQGRLGIATSLYTALRCRHPHTAAHSLRVALGCSAWALARKLPAGERDTLEIAALLHDVGKIGVPDAVLMKPGALSSEEHNVLNRRWMMGLEILRGCCATPDVLEIVGFAPAWYDGSHGSFGPAADQIPLGARMLSIVDAFDAMTTDQVYRPAMSRERAFLELFGYAGKQFDPDLVREFCDFHERNEHALHEQVADRWLTSLAPDSANVHWKLNVPAVEPDRGLAGYLFQQRLLDNMHDGVVFIDQSRRIILWNRGAERLTGISSSSAQDHEWLPSLVKMRDERGNSIADADCPILSAMKSTVQWLRRLTIRGRNGRDVPVDAHAVPIIGDDGEAIGATLLLHDASSEISLELRCHSLHEMATKDVLTQVANRGEFDRVYEPFLSAHLDQGLPCSMIICDVDHFKKVNDTFGHPAGDSVLTAFAKVLKGSCRPGDLVARYGGEEFVILCADCDNGAAARRAEELRRVISKQTHTELNGQSITASFGVTEIQPGDTPETMLRRADRAVYIAKARGRNQVVQLGTGTQADNSTTKAGWLRGKSSPQHMLEQDLITEVPLQVAAEKLRGFVADHDAEVVAIDEGKIHMRTMGDAPAQRRRSTDRPVAFHIELSLSEDREAGRQATRSRHAKTKIHVSVSPLKNRDRRRGDAAESARRLLVSLRAYLMATEVEPAAHHDAPDEPGVASKVARWLRFWRPH